MRTSLGCFVSRYDRFLSGLGLLWRHIAPPQLCIGTLVAWRGKGLQSRSFGAWSRPVRPLCRNIQCRCRKWWRRRSLELELHATIFRHSISPPHVPNSSWCGVALVVQMGRGDLCDGPRAHLGDQMHGVIHSGRVSLGYLRADAPRSGRLTIRPETRGECDRSELWRPLWQERHVAMLWGLASACGGGARVLMKCQASGSSEDGLQAATAIRLHVWMHLPIRRLCSRKHSDEFWVFNEPALGTSAGHCCRNSACPLRPHVAGYGVRVAQLCIARPSGLIAVSGQVASLRDLSVHGDERRVPSLIMFPRRVRVGVPEASQAFSCHVCLAGQLCHCVVERGRKGLVNTGAPSLGRERLLDALEAGDERAYVGQLMNTDPSACWLDLPPGKALM